MNYCLKNESLANISKYWFIIVVNFILINSIYSIELYSQEEFKSKINWQSIETNVPDSIKIQYLKLLKSNDYVDSYKLFEENDYENKESYDNFLNIELQKFHLLDINNDLLLDVIYEGRMPVGIEINDIVIYISKNDSLEVALKVMGEFDNLYINNNKLDSMIVVVNPCCAGFYFTRRLYSFVNNSKNVSLCKSDLIIEKYSSGYDEYFSKYLPCFLIEEEYFDYHFMEKPKNKLLTHKSFISNNKFYLTNNPGKLNNKKIGEDVDVSYFMEYNFNNETNNQIGIFKSKSEGLILATFKNTKGVEYAFVRLSNNYNIQSIFKKKNVFIYGWTEIKNLKIQY